MAIYIVSQFLRNSVGVIAPDLADEIGLSPAEIGLLSSTFFFAFAAVQIPAGHGARPLRAAALPAGGRGDHGGRRRRVRVGASRRVLIVGRALLGLGTAGSLVAPLALYARGFRPSALPRSPACRSVSAPSATLLATAPLAFSTATIGWRARFLGVGGVHACWSDC